MPGVCSTSKEKPKGISRLTNEPIDILIYDYFGQSKTHQQGADESVPRAAMERALLPNLRLVLDRLASAYRH
jgi:hypothetical protein